MINFSGIKELTIDGAKLKELSINGVKVWQAGRLPAGYTEVEYILASPNVAAYIDLGFAFDKKAKIETSMYFANVTYCYPFGAAENSGKLRCMISAPYDGKVFVYGSTGSAYIGTSTSSPACVMNAFNDIVATWEKGNLYVKNLTNNASANMTTQAEYTMTNHLYLFAQNYNGTARFHDSGTGVRQIRYFKYYDKNNTLIRDLVPAIRKSDGVASMFDLVSNSFMPVSGTGTFTAGPAVA